MDTKHLANVQHPGPAPRRIVESAAHSYAIDKAGKQVTDADGKPVLLATDANGVWCAKLGSGWPRSAKEREAAEDSGAFMHHSTDPIHHGVWVELPQPKTKK